MKKFSEQSKPINWDGLPTPLRTHVEALLTRSRDIKERSEALLAREDARIEDQIALAREARMTMMELRLVLDSVDENGSWKRH